MRISEDDLEGQEFEWHEKIVYIGMTCSAAGLKGRLAQFNNTLRDKSGGGHGGADRFRYDFQEKEKVEELENSLYVAVYPFPFKDQKPRDSVSVENLLVQGRVANAEYVALAVYVHRFTRLPKYNNMKASPKLSKSKKAITQP